MKGKHQSTSSLVAVSVSVTSWFSAIEYLHEQPGQHRNIPLKAADHESSRKKKDFFSVASYSTLKLLMVGCLTAK